MKLQPTHHTAISSIKLQSTDCTAISTVKLHPAHHSAIRTVTLQPTHHTATVKFLPTQLTAVNPVSQLIILVCALQHQLITLPSHSQHDITNSPCCCVRYICSPLPSTWHGQLNIPPSTQHNQLTIPLCALQHWLTTPPSTWQSNSPSHHQPNTSNSPYCSLHCRRASLKPAHSARSACPCAQSRNCCSSRWHGL